MRVDFLIDGFNLYHSVRTVHDRTGNPGVKWLNVWSLCRLFLPNISPAARINGVHHFTAYAHHLKHRDPDVVNRHKAIVKCLRETGVQVHVAKSKKKDVRCPRCHRGFKKHEEKETDVAIAMKAIELLHNEDTDAIVFVSGDTDLAPAIRTIRRVFPAKSVYLLFPVHRKNDSIKGLPHAAFKMRERHYRQSQFADPFICADGTQIQKPPAW